MGALLSVDAARWLQPLCAPLRRPDRAHPGRHTPALRTRVCRVRPARSDSQYMGPCLGGRASGACRPWRSGGSASIVPERIDPGTPNRTGRTNNFTASSKPTPRGPAAYSRTPNNDASPVSAPSTTTSGRMKPWTRPCQRRTISLRRVRCRAACRRWSIRAMRKFAGRSKWLRLLAPAAVCLRCPGRRSDRLRRSYRRWDLDRHLCHRGPRSLRRTAT